MNNLYVNVKNKFSTIYKFLNIFGNTYDNNEQQNKDELDVRCEKMEKQYEDVPMTVNELLKIEEEIKTEEVNEQLQKEVDEYLKMEEDGKIINQTALEELIDYFDNEESLNT
jgi:predicted transcriptional regulator